MSTASHRDLLLLPAASPITEAQGQGQAQAQAQARTATPTRPAHRRGFSTDGTPNHRPLRSLARGTPNNSSSPAALSPLLSLFDPENTPRKKPQLPSPPNSESTSSGSTHHPAGAAPPSDQLAMDSPLDNRPRSSWTGSLASRSRRGADADADSSAELVSWLAVVAPLRQSLKNGSTRSDPLDLLSAYRRTRNTHQLGSPPAGLGIDTAQCRRCCHLPN